MLVYASPRKITMIGDDSGMTEFQNLLAIQSWIKRQTSREQFHKEKGQRLISCHHEGNVHGVQPSFYKHCTSRHIEAKGSCGKRR